MMESSIHKIFFDKADREVHEEFVKFGKGIFENRYLVYGKKQRDCWAIKTSSEFANYLVRSCLEETSEDIDVKGVIVSTFDIKNNAGFSIERVKQFMGIKQAVVNTKTSPANIIDLMNKYPRAFYALSFAGGNYQLKIKAKTPKNAKPTSNGEKEIAADFCSLKTKNRGIIEDLFFDFPDFKEIKISNTININEIILPNGIENPAELREKAIRKGKIIRNISIDGREKKTDKEIEV